MVITGLLLVAFPILMTWGLYDLSEWYWGRERARGPAYWQALLDSEFRNEKR